jgi:hypothetical protein
MKVAFLIGEQALRRKLAGLIGPADVTVKEYPTAAKALTKLVEEGYDLIVIHWKVYPGFGSGDKRIDELAGMIPGVKLNRNVLYWEVALRVIDAIRAEGSVNRATPVIVILPKLGPSGPGTGDQLTKESVQSDIAARQPAEAVYGSSAVEFSKAFARHLPGLTR